MKKILLVQLPTSTLTGEKVYPLGLARLSSVIPATILKRGLDMNLFADPWPKLHALLTRFSPDIVAFSFRNIDPLASIHTSYVPLLTTGVKQARAALPEARLLCGGPGFSLFAKRLMQEAPELDFGLVGEGERSFAGLLGNEGSAADIPGLVWRDKEKILLNRPEHHQLDTLPELDTDLFAPADYGIDNAYVAAFGIEAKRGCALSCSYCTYPGLGGKPRLRQPKLVVDEMERLHNEFGCTLFHFTDPVVNQPADHLSVICKEILQRKLHIQWTGFFREDCLTMELAELACAAGLVTFYFSADALTDHGLALLNKRLTRDDIYQAARITAATGLLTCCHFLVNLPGEFPEHRDEARKTLETLLEIHAPAKNLGAVILNTARLYPDAPLTKQLLASKELRPETDLLYPTYYNPPQTAHILHELNGICHAAGVIERLEA